MPAQLVRRRSGHVRYQPYRLRNAVSYGRAAYQVARMGYKAYQGAQKYLPSSTSARPKAGSSSTVTRQHDLKTTYRSKRTPRRVKKLKRFAKRVRQAQNLLLPLHTLSEVTSNRGVAAEDLLLIDYPSPNVTFQNVWDTDATTPAKDLRLVCNNSQQGIFPFTNALQTVQLQEGATVVNMRENDINDIRVTYKQRLKMSLLNVAGYSMIVDIYVCVATTDIADNDYSTALLAWRKCMETTEVMNGPGNSYSIGSVDKSGVTPFDAPMFRKYWKVLSKQRIEMQPNEIVSTKFAPKGYQGTLGKWAGKTVKKGITHDIILVANPTFGGRGPPNQNLLNIQWSKLSHIRLPGHNVGTQMSFTGTFDVINV